jgi:phosphoribosylformimino-5-aminoimidazole carboxamide ribotide isomerase
MSHAMVCIPAIDVRAGRCVRLLKGDFAEETVYGDPVELAVAYEAAGASLLHVVDLDAAREGGRPNGKLIEAIVAATTVPVQLGGGIRDEASAEAALASGIARVVLGTAGVEDPALVRRLAERHPGRIVAGLDHRRVGDRRVVAVRGWAEASGIDLEDALAAFEGAPLASVVVTDIGRDGTLEGPDLEGYAAALSITSVPLVASGGIGSLEDLRRLAGLEAAGRRLAGVVVGKALLSGAFALEEAIGACACER